MRRYAGFLLSEYMTGLIVIVVGAAVAFGLYVGGQREAMLERAEVTIGAIRDRLHSAAADEVALACDNTIVAPEVLANDYLSFDVRPVPVQSGDESAGYGAAIFIQGDKASDGNDTFLTAKKLLTKLDEDDEYDLLVTENEEEEVAYSVVLSEYAVCAVNVEVADGGSSETT